MKYKSFKDYYWKNAIWRIGIPWGLLAGILFAIIQDKEVLRYFTSFATLIQILFFILGGSLVALTAGRSFWRRMNHDLEK